MTDYTHRYRETYKGIRIDLRAKTSKELQRKVERKKAQIDRQTVDPDMRLRDFCYMYLETYKKNTVSESWYKDLHWIADKLVDGVGNKPIGRIKPIEVQRFLNSCSCYADGTIKKIYDVTNQVFKQIMLNGSTDYIFNLTAPKGKESTSGRSLTAHEQDVLLNVIQGHRGELFVLIMYHCGLRPSEVAALTWKDIDLKRNVLTVNKALKKDGTVGATKSVAGVREVPIPRNLSTMLMRNRKSPFSLVCEQRNGYHTKTSLRKMWASIRKLASQELGYVFDYRLYDIRHTYCTNLERMGVPINIASRLMGHSDISITSKIYTHASDEAIEIARRCIEVGKVAGKVDSTNR